MTPSSPSSLREDCVIYGIVIQFVNIITVVEMLSRSCRRSCGREQRWIEMCVPVLAVFRLWSCGHRAEEGALCPCVPVPAHAQTPVPVAPPTHTCVSQPFVQHGVDWYINRYARLAWCQSVLSLPTSPRTGHAETLPSYFGFKYLPV